MPADTLPSDPVQTTKPADLQPNTAELLAAQARLRPQQPALIVARPARGAASAGYEQISFAELDRRCNQYANGLRRAGIARGTRTLLMVKPGIAFTALVYALFRIGAPPVMIDPGMGLRRLLQCVRRAAPQAMVAIPLAHVLRTIVRRPFASVRQMVTVGRKWFPGGHGLDDLAADASDQFDAVQPGEGELAAILFTSGSTGPAKGVCYEHSMFNAQVDMIRNMYGMRPGEVDVATFPLFALFSTGLGMTCVIPDMNASRPANADPRKILAAINDHNATSSFGSPALWGNVSRYCVDQQIELPTLNRILIAGAPVPEAVHQRLARVLPEAADVHTPYGATESLPVASISGKEILAECAEKTRHGAGTCVGRPVPGAAVRIIDIIDRAIGQWAPELEVPRGDIGEIVARGPAVTTVYDRLPEATARSKISDGDTIWHRIGDVGYFDEQGRLWFCGRKSQRVETIDGPMYTECVEPIFARHPAVRRCALVGVGEIGRQMPVLVVEQLIPRPGERLLETPEQTACRLQPRERVLQALRDIAVSRDGTEAIEHFLFHPSLPVDVRHNAKINRERLAAWAARKLKRKGVITR